MLRTPHATKINAARTFRHTAIPQKILRVVPTPAVSPADKQKADEIKEELILVDCVLLENPDEKNGINLWITAWFHNEKSVAFLK